MSGLLDKLQNQGSDYTAYDGTTPSKLVNADKATANNSRLHYTPATDGYSLDGNPATVSTTDKGDYIRMDSPLKTTTFLDAGTTSPSILDNQPGAYYANGEKLRGRYHNSAPEGRGGFVDDNP
jgi:hypothetical protein